MSEQVWVWIGGFTCIFMVALVIFGLAIAYRNSPLSNGLSPEDERRLQQRLKPKADADKAMGEDEFLQWEEDNWPDADDELRYRDSE